MNEANKKLLNFPADTIGAPVIIVDEGFDKRTVPEITEIRRTNFATHGSNCAWMIIKELAHPSTVYCFAGITRLDEAVKYAAEHGIKVISISMENAPLSQESINLCLQHDIIIVTGAGNRGVKAINQLTRIDECVMTVAAYNIKTGKIDDYSGVGSEVDVAAPTDWKIELWNGNIYPFGKTSAAVPVITSALSLYLTFNPDATIEEMKQFIYSNCKDIGAQANKEGHGLFVWPDKLEITKPKPEVPEEKKEGDNVKTVMLDAGHGSNGKGFNDPGAIGNGLHEADLTGEIVSLVVENLITYSKELAVTVAPRGELADRTDAANKAKVDFFLSVHINSSAGKGTGFESFTYPGAGVKTLSIQEAVHHETAEFFKKYGLPDRGMKQDNLYVLHHTEMPAVLVELGFIINAHDMEIVTGHKKELAQAITRGALKAMGIKEKEHDPLADAVIFLQAAGDINTPDYWLQNARPGKQCKGEYVALLIQRFVEILKG